MKKELR
jgi:hypothetical protein